MNAEFFAAVEDIEKEKGIPRDYMYEKIEQAMLAAFRRDNPDYGENVEVILDEDKKRIELVVHKTVVEQVEDPTMEIDVDSAKKLSKRAVIGDELTIPVETKKFGRIAAQAAKQVIIQGIREAERGIIYDEFNNKQHEVLTGTVYRIDRDTVVKVYHSADCLPDVQRERELARKALVLGIPTAIPYDVVRVGESYGSVFELLNSRSFSKLIAADPDGMDTYVDLYVDLMQKMHSTHVKPGDMPEMKAVALGWVAFLRDYLPPEQAEKLVALVEAVPERDTMLHGDYHTNNIVMQNDEVLIIDMDTLCVGHPIFELASMYLGFVAFGEVDPNVTLSFLKLSHETAVRFWKKALAKYLGTQDPEAVRAVEEKAMVIGYARLMRRTIRRDGFNTEDGRANIELCRARLADLLPRVDSLTF